MNIFRGLGHWNGLFHSFRVLGLQFGGDGFIIEHEHAVMGFDCVLVPFFISTSPNIVKLESFDLTAELIPPLMGFLVLIIGFFSKCHYPTGVIIFEPDAGIKRILLVLVYYGRLPEFRIIRV